MEVGGISAFQYQKVYSQTSRPKDISEIVVEPVSDTPERDWVEFSAEGLAANEAAKSQDEEIAVSEKTHRERGVCRQ